MPARHLFHSRRAILVGGLAAAASACAPRGGVEEASHEGEGAGRAPGDPAASGGGAGPQASDAAPGQAVGEPIVTLLGDSIAAGLGLPRAQALPAQLEAALRAAGVPARVRGAGVSGDTTAAALARMDFSVQDDSDLCVVALGGNDLLQGIAPERVRANLDGILRRLRARDIGVLLAGMRAPPRYGAYAADFDRIFPELAAAHGVPLYPFLLEGVALEAELNQPDGIHPNAAGVRRIAAGLAPAVAAALRGQAGAVGGADRLALWTRGGDPAAGTWRQAGQGNRSASTAPPPSR